MVNLSNPTDARAPMSAATTAIAISAEQIGGEEVNAVDARKLHSWLEVGRDYSTWFKDRVEEYGFVEGEDYSPISGNNTGERGQPKKDHLVTLDMAKELAMLERNERGRQVRRYFIAAEKTSRKRIDFAEREVKEIRRIAREISRQHMALLQAIEPVETQFRERREAMAEHIKGLDHNKLRLSDLPDFDGEGAE